MGPVAVGANPEEMTMMARMVIPKGIGDYFVGE
jgi:hypothetical protein